MRHLSCYDCLKKKDCRRPEQGITACGDITAECCEKHMIVTARNNVYAYMICASPMCDALAIAHFTKDNAHMTTDEVVELVSKVV